MVHKFVLIILLGLTALYGIESARILGLFSSPGKSHLIIHESLMVRLAELGHDVTVVSSNKIAKTTPPKFRHIEIPFENNEIEKTSERLTKSSETNSGIFMEMINFFTLMQQRHEYFLTHPKLQALKNNEQFDLVVVGWFINDFQLGVAAHFKCPSVVVITGKPAVFSRSFVGSPSGASYNPSQFSNIKGSMNFLQRVQNYLTNAFEFVVVKALDYFIFEPTYIKHFPSDKYPSFEETKNNISLVMVNHHFSQGGIESYVPAMIEVGGMQIKDKPSPLPVEIQQWLDGAKDGAIFFSMGSHVKISNLSPERRANILKTLSKLKQRVLWKYEAVDSTDIPPNVMIRNWFPQSDILAHPNTKLFITHCGLGSVTEAKFHGIPILGIPIYGDQPGNLKGVIAEGWGVEMLMAELTEESFTRALNEVLNNKTYAETVQGISRLYRDRPERPIDKATFWVEYVLRHNGAKHMQSPGVHLNVLQYHSWDVLAFLVLCLYISWKVIKWASCKLFRICKSKLKFKKD